MSHDHHHAIEEPLGASSPASVIADIGGDVGAAVLYVPEHLAGHEIEIRPLGRGWDGTHVDVRERRLGTAPVWAAFFGSLTAGRYELRVRDDDTHAVDVEVRGGGVAEARW